MFDSLMDRKFKVTLDINPNVPIGKDQKIEFSTNDRNTSVIEFTINKDLKPLDITDSTVTIFIVKPSRKVSLETVHVVDGTSGLAQVELKNESVLEKGYYVCELRIQKGEEVLTTKSFGYSVFQALQIDEIIETDDNFSALADLIQKMKNIDESEEERKQAEIIRAENEIRRNERIEELEGLIGNGGSNGSGSGGSNGRVEIEVAEARNGHKNLKERLNVDFASKVDKEEGKSLVADSDIEKLETLKNYDDTGIKSDIQNLQTTKADKTELHSHTNKEVIDKLSESDGNLLFNGKAIETEINLTAYATKEELTSKVDKVVGKSLVEDTEITRLQTLKNYDDTAIKSDVADLQTTKANVEHNHEIKDVAGLQDVLNNKANTSDLGNYIEKNQLGVANGVAKLNEEGKVIDANGNPVVGGMGAVTSVNGQTGEVVLTPSNIGAEPTISKNTAFNKNFGTTEGTVSEGNHNHTLSSLSERSYKSLTDTPTIPTVDVNKEYVDTELNKKIDLTEKAKPNGIATLDENGKIPSSQLNIDTSNSSTVTNALKIIKSNKDSEGIFTVVTYKRKKDDTIYCVSTLSGGTTPLYTTRTEQYYDVTGTSVIDTITYTLSYDGDGNLISEV